MITKQLVTMSCGSCGEALTAEIHVIEDCTDCGTSHPAVGTWTGDWLIRWMNSHRQPNVRIAP